MCLMQELTTNGDCIRAVRLRRGLTQRQLAKYLGVQQPTLNRYENNQRPITAQRLQEIATILIVPIALLYPSSCTCEGLTRVTPFPGSSPITDRRCLPKGVPS